MTPTAIKELATVNWSAVARLMGVHPSTISRTLHGNRRNPMLRRAICIATGLRADQIWPEKKAS